jgi:basic membrane protein A and related proteins
LRRSRKFASILTIGILALGATACGSDDSSGSSSGTDTTESASGAPASDIKVGMAYDVGGRGDQSFNDSAAAGLDQAKADLGIQADESEASDGEAESAREERLVTFAEAGYDPIIAIGFAYAESVGKVAAQYPDVHFAIIDDSSLADVPNVASLVFAEEQGSFLVGAAAGLKTKTNNVGFIGGVDVPLIHKFEAGYEAGVKASNPQAKVQVKYLTQPPDFSGFGDPAKGKTAAAGMYDNGADIVYHAAGGSGGGVFEAAADAGGLAIGVDSDQYNTADPSVQKVIMTSMLKNVNVAVYNYLTEVAGGTFPSGVNTYDLSVDGVGYSTSGGQIDDIKDQLDAFKQQIIDGEITVPTTP